MISALFNHVLARYGPLRHEWPVRYWPLTLLTLCVPGCRRRWRRALDEHRGWQQLAERSGVGDIEVSEALLARLTRIPDSEVQVPATAPVRTVVQWWPQAGAVVAAIVCGLLLGMNAELSLYSEYSENSLAYLDVAGTGEFSNWISGEEQ
ncbi:MAG: hypothetical protein ACPHN3_06105 [Spongiibacter sp.]